MLISRYSVGSDWRTPFERLRGRRCKTPVVPFGEYVFYKEIRDGKERKNKLEPEDKDGTYLGHARNSNEVLIGTPLGVVRAYSFRRRAEGRRWNKAAIEGMRGTPNQPDPSKPGVRIPMRISNSERGPTIEEEDRGEMDLKEHS